MRLYGYDIVNSICSYIYAFICGGTFIRFIHVMTRVIIPSDRLDVW